MTLEFDLRDVTKSGTVYMKEISYNETKLDYSYLKNEVVSINNKISKILDVCVEGRCNLTFTRYYLTILTDEEFEEFTDEGKNI